MQWAVAFGATTARTKADYLGFCFGIFHSLLLSFIALKGEYPEACFGLSVIPAQEGILSQDSRQFFQTRLGGNDNLNTSGLAPMIV